MKDKVAILGAGSWGTAIAILLSNNGSDVKLWTPDSDEAKMINNERVHRDKLPNVSIPENIHCTSDINTALEGSNAIFIVVPSKFIRSTAQKIKNHIKKEQVLVCCSKGIEEETGLLLTEVLEEEIPGCKTVVLSGPSHAEEVALGVPTAVVATSADISIAKYVQDLCMSSSFRVYTHSDVIGVEIGGALKNVIALCAGISDGLGYGDNTKAALMTRGMAEITRMGVRLGANANTFSGLTGIGDLIVTCTSMHSRNRRAGILLGQGKSLDETLLEVKMVVEGVNTTKAAYSLAEKYDVDMPIVCEAYKVLFEGKSPKEAVNDLMTREKKDESEDLV